MHLEPAGCLITAAANVPENHADSLCVSTILWELPMTVETRKVEGRRKLGYTTLDRGAG